MKADSEEEGHGGMGRPWWDGKIIKGWRDHEGMGRSLRDGKTMMAWEDHDGMGRS